MTALLAIRTAAGDEYLTCQGRWELRDDAAMAARDAARR
jgi:hypothetical protein